MKNYLQPGDKITVPAPATVTSGSGTVLGTLLGVATHDAASGASCTFLIEGVVTLPKLTAAVIAVGDRLHWDVDSSPPQFIKASPAAGDILNCAVAVAAAGSSATTVAVKLTPEAGSVAGASGGVDTSIAANTTSINNLNTWAGVLAAKLNLDAGVADTNYDTDPQT
jgi:predicted RecA/RadA family phage recombinase